MTSVRNMEIKLPLASLKANSHTSGPHMSKILNNDTPASDSVEKFREKLRAAQHIIVVAGAGLSAASGIPTFRGEGGMWRSLNAMELATPEAFKENPSLVWQFYHYRRVKALEAEPNAAHKVLAQLMIPAVLESIAPNAKTYHVITQNVDRLSPRAFESLMESRASEARQEYLPRADALIEMHGRLFDLMCTECENIQEDLSNPLCPALGISERRFAGYKANSAGEGKQWVDIPEADLPRCLKCGALARLGVVWFGEVPFHLDRIWELVEQADLCIVVGTSSTVYPAAGYASEVYERGGTVAVFNLEKTDGDADAGFIFYGPCETELIRVLGVQPE